MKRLNFILLLLTVFSFAISGCSIVKTAQKVQGYVEKHCPKTEVRNPFTGDIMIHYECQELWHAEKLKAKCPKINVCIDVVNGKISGDVDCPDVISVAPEMKGVSMKKER